MGPWQRHRADRGRLLPSRPGAFKVRLPVRVTAAVCRPIELKRHLTLNQSKLTSPRAARGPGCRAFRTWPAPANSPPATGSESRPRGTGSLSRGQLPGPAALSPQVAAAAGPGHGQGGSRNRPGASKCISARLGGLGAKTLGGSESARKEKTHTGQPSAVAP